MAKNKSNVLTQTIIVAIIASIIASVATVLIIDTVEDSKESTQEELIQEFYDVETAAHVSPHGLRKHLGEDPNVVIVDLRSQEEYEEEHIITAINIPAYRDRDHSDYGAVDRIVGEFQAVLDENPDAEFIVYCYSIPCMTGRKMGKVLADHDIYVQHLGVGWNEWRYYWELWNHPHEWEITNVEDYISSGPEPGTFGEGAIGTGCPIEGEFGC